MLERLELIIPGFKGYKERELIREDDALVRRKIASILDESRGILELHMGSIRRKDINLALRLDDLRLEMMKAAQMVRHAPHGYAGFFDRLKIKEEQLQQLLRHDYQLLSDAQKVLEHSQRLRSLEKADEVLAAADSLHRMVLELERRIAERNRLFKVGV